MGYKWRYYGNTCQYTYQGAEFFGDREGISHLLHPLKPVTVKPTGIYKWMYVKPVVNYKTSAGNNLVNIGLAKGDNVVDFIKDHTDPKIDLAVGAIGYKIGKILKNRAAYGKIVSPVVLKTAVANLGVSAKALQTTGNVLKGAGVALGVAGVGVTAYEIGTGQKNLIGEGGLDVIMGGVG